MTDHPRKPATIAAQAGGAIDTRTGGVVPALHTSTTYARHADYTPLNSDNMYGRDDNDTVRMAESIISQLENAADTLLFPSGMAAIAAVFRTVANNGSVVIQSQIYWGTTKWIREFCARRSIKLVEVDAANSKALEDACQKAKPSIVFVETPSNPWLRTVDIQNAAACAHNAGGLLVVDGTAATPVLTKALDFGADIAMHAATKAMNGHSDVLAGALSTRNTESTIWPAIQADRHDAGAIMGPFEAWLLIRGMRTLPLRVERMSENALTIARFLDEHAHVETVLYPGLEGHAGHALAKQQMVGGYGSLLSFTVKGSAKAALMVAGKLTLFHRATSLGGVESLVEHRHTIEPHTGIPENLLRLSIGIEDANDLIDDLKQALED